MKKEESMIAEYIKVIAGQDVTVEIVEGMVVLEKEDLWHIYLDDARFILIGTADYAELDKVIKLTDIKDGILNIFKKVSKSVKNI